MMVYYYAAYPAIHYKACSCALAKTCPCRGSVPPPLRWPFCTAAPTAAFRFYLGRVIGDIFLTINT
jgi:hypothetical protein